MVKYIPEILLEKHDDFNAYLPEKERFSIKVKMYEKAIDDTKLIYLKQLEKCLIPFAFENSEEWANVPVNLHLNTGIRVIAPSYLLFKLKI